jgi:hypothetical protein
MHELTPKLSGCSGGCTPGAELPPKLAGPLRGISAADRQLRRGELGGSTATQLPVYNPFLLQVTVHGLQRVKDKVPFPQFFSTMSEITQNTSLYLVVEVADTSDAVFMISFWP